MAAVGNWNNPLNARREQAVIRTFTLAFLAVCAPVLAQTNYGTITFTNKSGDVISNAVVTKVEAGKLTYRYSVGIGGGLAKLSELPLELQQRFGYDSAAGVAEEEKEKAEAMRAQARAAALAAEAANPIFYSAQLRARTNAAGAFALASELWSRPAPMDTAMGSKLMLEVGAAGYIPAMLWLAKQYASNRDPEGKLGELGNVWVQGGSQFSQVQAPDGKVTLYKGENPFAAAAVRWFRKAAQEGNADAQYKLGEYLAFHYQRRPEPVPRESEISDDSPAAQEAAQWFTKAASQGDKRATLRLAQDYAGGIGVPRNSVKAMQLYEQAEAFYEMAKLSLANANRVAALVWWGVGNARQKQGAPFTSEYAAITFTLAERESSAHRAALYLLQRYGSTNSASVTQPKRFDPAPLSAPPSPNRRKRS